MTEYEDVYMELRGCTFEVKLPKDSVTAIIQSMIDKTTLVCPTSAPKKCCRNCKHCMIELWKLDGITVIYRCDCRDDPYEDFDPDVTRICDKWGEKNDLDI